MTGMSTDHDLDPDYTNLRKSVVKDSELTRCKVRVAALQETRLAEAGLIKEENYTFYWFSKSAAKPGLCGTGFAVFFPAFRPRLQLVSVTVDQFLNCTHIKGPSNSSIHMLQR